MTPTNGICNTSPCGDELGFDEAWIGEHFTSPWEPIPAPDLLIAQALMQTKRIKLGSGAHLLPFHHPAELAHRVAYLDHISQGRVLFGVGASGLPSDWALFDVDGNNGVHRDMTRESLDIILKYGRTTGLSSTRASIGTSVFRSPCMAPWSSSCAPTSNHILPSVSRRLATSLPP